MKENLNQSLSRIKSLGGSFEKIAQIDSPAAAVGELLSYLGNTFQCERVYILEKNDNGNYDCTAEWISDRTYSKKHLMQNLPPKAVRYYYNYFLRGKRLIVRDMEAFKQEDYPLYKILKPQGLQELLCGQLIYDGKDLGFIGIDNPSAQKFEEVENIFDALNYFIAVQIHRKGIREKLINESEPVVSYDRLNQFSIHERIFRIRMEEPLALVYCDVALNQLQKEFSDEMVQRLLNHTGNVLSSIFGAQNVFHLGPYEFLIFYEDTEDMDISSINHYMMLAKRTLEEMHIYISMGVVETSSYSNNFFELVNKANARMLRNEQRYRDIYTEKYHMGKDSARFRDLVEIRPTENYYHVLFSEYESQFNKEGRLDLMLKELGKKIHRESRPAFQKFWEEQLALKHPDKGPAKETFSVYEREDSLIRISVSIVSYEDVNGDRVMICYSE